MIILPRQARDKRSKNSWNGCFLAEKRRAWLVGVSPVCGCEVRLLHAAGAKNACFLRRFRIVKRELTSVCQDRLGTYETLRKRTVFAADDGGKSHCESLRKGRLLLLPRPDRPKGDDC